MVELFGIYRRLVGARIRSQLQYRLSFALNVIAVGLITFLDFAVILVLFEQVDALGEWSVAEAGVLYGISCVSFALTDIAIGHLDLLPRMIREGNFDLVLVRPLGSLFQVIASDFALRKLGKFIQGLAVLLVAAVSLDLAWTPARIGMLVLGVVAGAAIFAGIWIALATIAFLLIDSMEAVNAFRTAATSSPSTRSTSSGRGGSGGSSSSSFRSRSSPTSRRSSSSTRRTRSASRVHSSTPRRSSPFSSASPAGCCGAPPFVATAASERRRRGADRA